MSKIKKIVFLKKKSIVTKICFKFLHKVFFYYCIKIRLLKFDEDCLKNVEGDRF